MPSARQREKEGFGPLLADLKCRISCKGIDAEYRTCYKRATREEESEHDTRMNEAFLSRSDREKTNP